MFILRRLLPPFEKQGMLFIAGHTLAGQPTPSFLDFLERSALVEYIIAGPGMSQHVWFDAGRFVLQLVGTKFTPLLVRGERDIGEELGVHAGHVESHCFSEPVTVGSIRHHHGVVCCSCFCSLPQL